MARVWFNLLLSAVVLGLCAWIAFPSADRLRRRGETFARTNHAYVDSEFVPLFDRASRRGFRFAAVLLLVMQGAEAVAYEAGGRLPFELVLLPVGSVFFACWSLSRVRTAGREFPAPSARRAVARPRRVVLSDYVAVPLQVLTLADVIVAVAVAGVVLGRPGTGHPAALDAATVVGAAALVAGIVVAQLWGRAMCERPQPAVDPCHLYFQDAWRAQFLVAAHGFVACGAGLLLMGLAIPAGSPGWLADAVFGGVLPVVCAVQFGAFLGWRLWFRRRLWPTLARGQVLLPGEAFPLRAGVSA